MNELNLVKETTEKIINEMEKRIIGNRNQIKLILITLFAKGHVLLEGVPGIAKSYLASTLSDVLGMDHKRIQFTPDLMPADITGSSIYNPKDLKFEFIPGPIFTNIVLCDEISRAPPKTQAALLESMQELQVTVEGITRKLDRPFFVMATQNPIEQVGVYPLPEAQLDRFMIRLMMSLPNYEEEVNILRSKRANFIPKVNVVSSRDEIIAIQKVLDKVDISDSILDYIARLVVKTRFLPALALGGSPRASIALMTMCRAKAAMEGRSYVEPDDVKYLFFHVMNHRIILTPQAEVDQVPIQQIVDSVIKETPVNL
ncbi:MAG: MoxR family ATPase [Candidatus Heimdallarchaeota archaeon]|nr:MoxR family ATPase [Candidatus Heimdallarchaeota archaeon]MDH5646321.1 MoxR family ATPase [Candidatus Heimdallarchaeota archaeon]